MVLPPTLEDITIENISVIQKEIEDCHLLLLLLRRNLSTLLGMDGVRESDKPFIMWSRKLVNQCLQTSVNYEVEHYFANWFIVRGERSWSVLLPGERQRKAKKGTNYTSLLDTNRTSDF